MSKEQILPCPFCGGDASIEETPSASVQNGTRKTVGCSTEDCYGYLPTVSFETRKEAISRWNTRAQIASLQAEKQALVEALQSALKLRGLENSLLSGKHEVLERNQIRTEVFQIEEQIRQALAPFQSEVSK